MTLVVALAENKLPPLAGVGSNSEFNGAYDGYVDASNALWGTLGTITSFKRDGNQVVFDVGRPKVKLTIQQSNIVRVQMTPSGTFPSDTLHSNDYGPYEVLSYNWPSVSFSVSEQSDKYIIKSDELTIVVRKSPFKLTILGAAGEMLLEESENSLRHNGEQRSETFILPENEHIFGFGGRGGLGVRMDYRGKRVSMFASELGESLLRPRGGFPVPFYMSSLGYGLFVDNLFDAVTFRIGSSISDRHSIKVPKGEIDYYVIYGPSLGRILDGYTDITGKAPLPPKFMFGWRTHLWGRNGITPTIINLAQRYRDEGFPADMVTSPEVPRFASEIELENITNLNMKNVITHRAERDWEVADANGWRLCPPGTTHNMEGIDFTNSAAREWYAQEWGRYVVDGRGEWGVFDHGERFGNCPSFRETFANGEPVRSLAPLLMAKMMYQTFEQNGKYGRIIRSRGGTAGSQRYALPWPGDLASGVSNLFAELQFHINAGLSGFPFSEGEMGGYTSLFLSDEEWARRIAQMALVAPMTGGNVHSKNGRHPWESGPKAQDLYRFYFGLRYRLLPYIYTYAITAHQTGAPILRPLVFEYQYDTNTYDRDYDMLFGSEILVSPVITEGVTQKSVYLPEGTWIHYWNGTEYTGPGLFTVDAPIFGKDGLPMFIKQGAIIPMMQPTMHIDEESTGMLTLDVYPKPGGSSSFVMKDTNRSINVKAPILETTFNSEDSISDTKIQIGSSNRNYTIVVHQNQRPFIVLLNGRPLKELGSADALTEASQGWYYGSGVFAGSGSITTVNVKVQNASGRRQTITLVKSQGIIVLLLLAVVLFAALYLYRRHRRYNKLAHCSSFSQ